MERREVAQEAYFCLPGGSNEGPGPPTSPSEFGTVAGRKPRIWKAKEAKTCPPSQGPPTHHVFRLSLAETGQKKSKPLFATNTVFPTSMTSTISGSEYSVCSLKCWRPRKRIPFRTNPFNSNRNRRKTRAAPGRRTG